MKLNNYLLTFLLLLPFGLQAQEYLFPVKPGQRNHLAGNFSEIRPNHFHSGIDIKIGGVDGEPIIAISDGYIWRAKVSAYGYGNVLYLKHTNGQSSVYAHLRNFSPKITEFMRKEMYFAKNNELEVFPDPEFLPIKKGEIIANGGNTGSSGGPHLHFEIRDSLELALDPQKFGFKELVDNLPPIVYRVALRPLDIESRVNGKYQRQEFTPFLEGGRYILNQNIKITGRVGLEIYAVDKADGVNNIFGVPVYELMEGEKPLYRINVDHVDFNTGRFLLTHTHQNRFVRLYQYPNNPLQIYEPDSVSAGAITSKTGEKKSLMVNVKDANGNTRVLRLTVEGEDQRYDQNGNTPSSNGTLVTYDREVMMIRTGLSDIGNLAKVFINGHVMEVPPAYISEGKRTYIWDMNYGVPDSLDLCTAVINSGVLVKIPFGKEYAYSDTNVRLRFEKNTLLDDLFLRTDLIPGVNSNGIKINGPDEYLQSNMEVTLPQPTFTGDKNHSHIYLLANNGRKSFVGGEWEGNDIRFKTRIFGTFVLDQDRIPPKITPVRVNSNELRFKISDEKSGIRDFEAFVEGEWVLMRYEYKQALIWSEKQNNLPFKGKVLLKVRDMAGNEASYTTILK